MPKTVIIRNTWRCPVCPHPGPCQWDNDSLDGQVCPNCHDGIIGLTNIVERMGTLTIMGPEDVEEEILERDESTYRARRITEISNDIERRDGEGQFATTIAKELALSRATATLDTRIAEKRDKEFFLEPEEVAAYRQRRLNDIDAAIAVAKTKEYKQE